VGRKLVIFKQVSRKTFVLPVPLTAPGDGFSFGTVQLHSITWKLFLRADRLPYHSLYKCVRQCSRNSPCIAWPWRMGPIRCP